MRFRLLLGLSATIAALSTQPVSAQTATTSECRPTASGGVVCDTTEAPQGSIEDRCLATGLLETLGSKCTAAEIKEARSRVALKKQVGELLASGQCDEAIRTALKAGNFDLATQAKALCIKPAS